MITLNKSQICKCKPLSLTVMHFVKQNSESVLFLFQELFVSKAELKSLCDYYFDGKGKAFRPMIVVLMARACNVHSNKER